jgi:hypothetical protein
MDTVPNFTNRNNVAMLVEDIEHRLRATNLDHEPHADEILELVQEQETNAAQEAPYVAQAMASSPAIGPRIQDMVSQATDLRYQTEYMLAFAELRAAEANVITPEQVRQAVQASVGRALQDLEAIANRRPITAHRARSEEEREAMLEELYDQMLAHEAAQQQAQQAAHETVYEAAMGDDGVHQGPPVANIDDLEDQVEAADLEDRYTWALTRLRILQATAIDPQQAAQAVQAARARRLSSLQTLVNGQQPHPRAPRAPRAPDATQQAAALARVMARFAAVGL